MSHLYHLHDRPQGHWQTRHPRVDIAVVWMHGPFAYLDANEEEVSVNASTPGWERGYYLAYPANGHAPFAISRAHLQAQYTV